MNRTENYPYCASDWVRERLEKAGAEILSCDGTAYKKNRIAKNKHGITLNTVQFDGILRTKDSELLKNALINGIGHGKAYG